MQVAEETNKKLKDELMTGKIKIDELQSKIAALERTLRNRDEETFSIAKELDICRSSIQSFEQNEASIKHEVINIIHSRNQAEKDWQELRMQNSDLNGIIRQLSDKIDYLSRNESKYISEIKLLRHQAEQFENYTSVLELEKQKLEQKLKEERDTNLSLQQMCTEILEEHENDSDSNKIILEKEFELKRLKEKQKLRKLSRENTEIERLRTKVHQSRNRLNDSLPESLRQFYLNQLKFKLLHSVPKSTIEYDYINEKPTQDVSVENFPIKSRVSEYEARKLDTVEDDPFWKNRDAMQRISQDKRVSRVEEFLQERVSSRKKQKIDASEMPPAGLRSVERLKNNITPPAGKIPQQRYEDAQMALYSQNYNI